MSRGDGEGVTGDEVGKPVTAVRVFVWFHFYVIPFDAFQETSGQFPVVFVGAKSRYF